MSLNYAQSVEEMKPLAQRASTPVHSGSGGRWWIFSPRFIVLALTILFTVSGYFTTLYTPAYLAYPNLWTAASVIAATVCAVALVRPSRLFIALSGGVAVAAAASRSVAITIEVIGSDFSSGEQRASFVIAATTWAVVAFLAYAAYVEVISPWSIERQKKIP